MPRTALVTGIAGFVGSALARRLLADGWTVRGIDSMSDYYEPALKRANLAWVREALQGGELDLDRRDLTDVGLDLDALVDGIDVVFHLAGQPGVRASWGDGFRVYTRANVDATQQLLEAVARAPRPPKVVYASSSSVYGDAERFPTSEDDLPAPISPYGVTKLAGEHLIRLYARLHGLPTVALRFFTVYGPRQRPDMAFTRFIRAALAGEPITVFGDGEQIREFTYVDDIVAALLAAADRDVEPGRVFNVSGGASVSVNEVLAILGRLVGAIQVQYEGRAAGDVFRTGGSVERIRAELGWAPTVAIEDGLARQVAWARAETA